jgi:hypothetical protein
MPYILSAGTDSFCKTQIRLWKTESEPREIMDPLYVFARNDPHVG